MDTKRADEPVVQKPRLIQNSRESLITESLIASSLSPSTQVWIRDAFDGTMREGVDRYEANQRYRVKAVLGIRRARSSTWARVRVRVRVRVAFLHYGFAVKNYTEPCQLVTRVRVRVRLTLASHRPTFPRLGVASLTSPLTPFRSPVSLRQSHNPDSQATFPPSLPCCHPYLT